MRNAGEKTSCAGHDFKFRIKTSEETGVGSCEHQTACGRTRLLHYFKKLNKITLVLSVLWNALIFAATPLIGKHSAISPEAKELVIWLVLINNIFSGLAYPFAGSLGNGLRAAGDVKFTMIVSIVLTVAARLFFSALFGMWLSWGVIGVAIGMSIDFVFHGAIFIWRQKSQKWTQFIG